ncbi:MAG TPA: PHP-associated domain-containing protein [Polyangia bacterium]
MKRLMGDLHVHTVLSPCAAPEMTPAAIVARAAAAGLALIAVCDHNSAGNAAATQAAAAARSQGARLAVLAGLEITTAEEAHVLGLFADAAAAEAVGAAVTATLPLLVGPPRWMGPQLLVDADGAPRGREPRMLHAASTLTVAAAVALIHDRGGLAIAAHVDRPSFSVIGQLGGLPEDALFDALEVSAAGLAAGRARALAAHGVPLVASSDSHSLEEIGAARTIIEAQAPTFAELRLALAGAGGRWCAHA